MPAAIPKPGALPPYLACRQFLLGNIEPGVRVLDIGCGAGELMTELRQRGVDVVGVEIDESAVKSCVERGLNVVVGTAEKLPFPSRAFGGILCSVVIPYTNERLAIAEWSRILMPGGFVRATFHGIGYALQFVAGRQNSGYRGRLYGARMLLNTGWYGITQRRLPGFFGDTLCQLPGRLQHCYARANLSLQEQVIVNEFAGAPVFFGQSLVKANTLEELP